MITPMPITVYSETNELPFPVDDGSPSGSFTGKAIRVMLATLKDFSQALRQPPGLDREHLGLSGYCLFSIYDSQPQLTHKLTRLFRSSCRVADPGY